MAAVDLVGLDAEPFVAWWRTQRRGTCGRRGRGGTSSGSRPRRERPRLIQHLRRLVAFSPPRLGGERGRDVVVEDVLVLGLLVAAVPPPVLKNSPGEGIIPATRTSYLAGRRAHTSGAVSRRANAPRQQGRPGHRPPDNGVRVLRPTADSSRSGGRLRPDRVHAGVARAQRGASPSTSAAAMDNANAATVSGPRYGTR